MHKYKQQIKSLLNFHLLLLILKINIKKTNMQPFFFFQESICNCNIKQTQTQTLGKLIIEIICLFLASYYITLHFFQLLNMTNNSIPIWYDMSKAKAPVSLFSGNLHHRIQVCRCMDWGRMEELETDLVTQVLTSCHPKPLQLQETCS